MSEEIRILEREKDWDDYQTDLFLAEEKESYEDRNYERLYNE